MVLHTARFVCCVWLVLAAVNPLAFAQVPPDWQADWSTDWTKRTISLDELEVNIPRDAIPSIDAPQFVGIADARQWLAAKEPVIVLVIGDEARAYPLQILTWHEIVNDRIGDRYVAVTFCPLCYSAIAFDRTVDGRILDFGVSGMLRHSDLVMFDRQTHTLWQQLSGKGIVGTQVGTTLKQLPAQLIAFEQFWMAYPTGVVLSRETGHVRDYGRNPYSGYDDVSKRPWAFRGEHDGRLPPMEKVVAVSLPSGDKAYPHRLTRRERVVHDAIGAQPLVVFHTDGAVSALDRGRIAASREVGSTGVFDPRLDGTQHTFRYRRGQFRDEQTGSTWDITGRAIRGPLEGRQLTRLAHGDYFAFAWFVFKPDTELYSDR